MMKKILVVLVAAFAVVSCLDDGPQNRTQYTMVATFEYVNDYNVNQFFGADSLLFDEAYGYGFQWNDVLFCHKLSEDKRTFNGGFMLSCLKGEVYSEGYEPDMEKDMFRVNAPADSSRTYTVFKDAGVKEMMPVHDVEFVMNDYGTCELIGCLVNIPLYVAYAAANEFRDGDVLKVRVTGYGDGREPIEKSMDLITCEGGKLEMITKWTLFDLKSLGDIHYLDIEVESTNDKVPEIVCIDNFGAKISVEY